MRQTIKRWGNSPAVRIPSQLMAAMALDVDAEVEVNVVFGSDNRPQLVIEPVTPAPTLEALLAKVTPENIHSEAFTDEVGKEAW
ncbi:antitoxin MazE [Erwinia sp. PK3-005]|uniref:Antitoxin MazE n=1 Tax=Mixta hanseatica TaxID=2872648 RepID=A0ABY4RBC4_9GAMM|nr:antitoxin MazE [Mixta hanseatica]UQY45140.1 antitoxin MazE [Mixta hanseatica]